MKKPIVAVSGLLAAAMTLSSPAWAGRDPLLQMAEQKSREAQAVLQQAETAKAAERGRLMGADGRSAAADDSGAQADAGDREVASRMAGPVHAGRA